MVPVVISVEPLEGYRLRIAFGDGTVGDVDISELVPFEGVFEPLARLDEFRRVQVEADSGTISWPGGADIDPLVLYARVKGVEVEKILATESSTSG